MEPAARQVERVARAHGDVHQRLARVTHLGGVLLVLQRQFEKGRVDEPALLALDLEAQHVVGVVVHLEALRARGRVVRVRLRGMTELALELAAELRERRMVVLERLEDDRRAAFELGATRSTSAVPENERRRPWDVLRVVAEPDRGALLDDAERRMAQAARGDAALDLGDRQQVVETALLVAWDEEGFPLPVLTEEALGFDGCNAARECAA